MAMTWAQAVAAAEAQARSRYGAAGQWPKLDNRGAASLILFARAALQYGNSHGAPGVFDWYAFALPALSYLGAGDRFNMSTQWQEKGYAPAAQLWSALELLARVLDGMSVPFKLVADPAPTEGRYKQLAADAWAKMRAESPHAAPPKPASLPPPAVKPAPATDYVTPAPAPAREKQSDGGGAGILFALLLLALADN